MIQERSLLFVADNTGIKVVMCIKVLGGTNRRYAGIKDIIKVVVKEVFSKSKIKKGEVFKAVIVRTKYGICRSDGSIIRFDNNSCVILNNNNQILGTRIFGPIARELRTEKFMKIVSLAQEVI